MNRITPYSPGFEVLAGPSGNSGLGHRSTEDCEDFQNRPANQADLPKSHDLDTEPPLTSEPHQLCHNGCTRNRAA
jgi:hypothetical protein